MKKVMIVDDNALAAEGIEKNIRWEELDAQVSIIQYNSRSALEAMKEIPVDLIISDIEMPDLDGISMSKLALSINPQVKIILVSAYDKFEYAKRAGKNKKCLHPAGQNQKKYGAYPGQPPFDDGKIFQRSSPLSW